MHSFYKKTKKKVFICADKNELFENYELACTLIPPAEILIQEIIPGDSSNQYSVGMLFLNKTVYSHIVVCRKRQHPIDFGNATTYAETVQVPKLKEYAVKILMHASYNGICEVEFKKDEKDGSYKFLEVNTRTWKWHSIANKAKTPFVPLFFEHLNGEKIYPVDSYKRSSFLHFLTDFVIRLKLMLKGKFNLLGKTKPFEKAIWAKDDKKPWFFEKLYIFHLLKTR